MFTRYTTGCLIALTVSLAVPAPAPAADTFAEVAEKANKKLVKIFGAGGFSRLNSFGTGIIVSKDGHVVTVASQLLDTSELVVHLYDGRRLKAQVLATEPRLDAAVIKIKLDGQLGEEEYFDFAAAAKAPPLAPGDWVIAMTNTFEIALKDEPLSIQRGVVSAYTKMAGRRGVFEFPYTGDVYVVDMISNNPGAAGGALLTRKGELTGIVGRELKNTLSDTWMNYAVPVTARFEIREKIMMKDKDGKDVEQEKVTVVTMAEFVEKAMQGTYKPPTPPPPSGASGGYTGIIFVPDILERTPAYIEDVVPGSPADKAGLRPDDLVSFIDGEPIISIKAFHEYLKKNTRPGMLIRLEVRRGESLETVEMTLGAPPVPPKPPVPAPPAKQ